MVQNRCMKCGRGPGSSWPFGPYLACRETLGKALSLTGYAAARVGLESLKGKGGAVASRRGINSLVLCLALLPAGPRWHVNDVPMTLGGLA